MKKILAAIDFSDASEAVLDLAGQLARQSGAQLEVAHVYEAEPVYQAYGLSATEFPALQDYQLEVEKRAQAALSRRMERLPSDLSVQPVLLVGGAVRALLEHARQSDCDLIVAGSHGHGAVASLLLGSVTEGLVRKAEVPTLVVPVGKR